MSIIGRLVTLDTILNDAEREYQMAVMLPGAPFRPAVERHRIYIDSFNRQKFWWMRLRKYKV